MDLSRWKKKRERHEQTAGKEKLSTKTVRTPRRKDQNIQIEAKKGHNVGPWAKIDETGDANMHFCKCWFKGQRRGRPDESEHSSQWSARIQYIPHARTSRTRSISAKSPN
jgi:hypothetical protein